MYDSLLNDHRGQSNQLVLEADRMLFNRKVLEGACSLTNSRIMPRLQATARLAAWVFFFFFFFFFFNRH
jgi:hypothetical protein